MFWRKQEAVSVFILGNQANSWILNISNSGNLSSISSIPISYINLLFFTHSPLVYSSFTLNSAGRVKCETTVYQRGMSKKQKVDIRNGNGGNRWQISAVWNVQNPWICLISQNKNADSFLFSPKHLLFS